MNETSTQEKSTVFPGEGYTLTWDTSGLNFEINDYHIQPFQLPWAKIKTIAESMGYTLSRRKKKKRKRKRK